MVYTSSDSNNYLYLNTSLYKVFPFTEFSVLPSNITGRISFPARFDCQPSSPDGFVRWAIGSDFLMLNNDSCPGCQRLINNSLYIPAVNQGHEGAYTCFLFNVGGGLPRFTVYLTIAG